jgi:hypothetical protein
MAKDTSMSRRKLLTAAPLVGVGIITGERVAQASDTTTDTKYTSSGVRTETVETPLPAGLSTAIEENPEVRIELKRVLTRMMHDQSAMLMMSDGCISNPHGPGC